MASTLSLRTTTSTDAASITRTNQAQMLPQFNGLEAWELCASYFFVVSVFQINKACETRQMRSELLDQ
jgi:hypothetical protein